MCNIINNNVGEAAADDHATAEKAARRYVDRLLESGTEIPVDEDTTSYEMTLPDWYDDELFKRAQKYYHDNIFAMFAGKLIGLLAVLSVPSILSVLTFTKGSGSRMTAYRRYLATIFHTMSWYDEALKPGSRSWRSLEAVRKGHVRVSLKSARSKTGIISQKDMALTQFGFVGFILLKPHLLGVQVTRANHEALVHFWRVIGHMIGIHDDYNLLTESWATTRPRLQLVLAEIYQPYLTQTSAHFYDMADHLISGLWCFNPFINTDAFLYFTKLVTGCAGYVYYDSDMALVDHRSDNGETIIRQLRPQHWASRAVLCMLMTMHGYLLNFSYIRWYMNAQIHVSKFIISVFPFLAIYMFGARMAYVRILGE